MDDRDFIYWMNGIFEFGEFDVFKTDQIELIMENIIEVYDNVQKHGILNDFDSMRVIAFIEGALMYFEGTSIEHKVKITTLVRNEIKEMFWRFQDDSPDARFPLMRERSPVENLILPGVSMDIIPLTPEMIENLKGAGVTHIDLSPEKTSSILEAFSKILKGSDKPKEKNKTSELSMGHKKTTEPVEPLDESEKLLVKDIFDEANKYLSKPESTDPLENATIDGAIDNMFEDEQEDINSLDAIADKIASRA